MSWPELEKLYSNYGLPPEIQGQAWRDSIPIFSNRNKNNQVGYATSGTWSPILKKNIALATVKKGFSEIGTKLQIETTVEHKRHTVTASVAKPQFFNPERKVSNPTKSSADGPKV